MRNLLVAIVFLASNAFAGTAILSVKPSPYMLFPVKGDVVRCETTVALVLQTNGYIVHTDTELTRGETCYFVRNGVEYGLKVEHTY